MPVFIFIILALLGFYFFRNNEKQKEERALEERLAREKSLAFFNTYLPNINDALKKFRLYDKKHTGYFSNYELTSWKTEFAKLYETIRKRPFENIGLGNKDVDSIKLFQHYYTNGVTLRKEYNKEFIQNELQAYRSFFDNIEGRKLDLQQRTAIVTDEDNNIVIAGAGSGKTTTIVGKVNYIIHRYKIPANEILLISFTGKSASTLAERININGMEAKTFHKFGKDVITTVEQRQPTIFDEAQFRSLIVRFFKELLKDPAYIEKVTSYFTNFLKPERLQDEFNNQGEYIQYLKDQNFSTYKTKLIEYDGRTTIKREIVKSIEECKIANFLLFNGVDYKYESPYPFETATPDHRQYKPDFTINNDGEFIYLEHFGIGKNGKVPHFFANEEKKETVDQATQKYVEGIKWKREVHAQHGTTLIETYSYEMFNNLLFDTLSENLQNAGVKLTPKSPEAIWKIIVEAASDEIDSFITLFQAFITLMKSNNYSIEDVRNRNKTITNPFHHKRNNVFLELISPIYENYQKYLAERKEIDFSDMINVAAGYISNGNFKRKFSYVIIDEFQDISIGRYQLIKAIKQTNPACKFFCVGDDWQSIYRFSGSDIALFKDFEKYFGYTVRSLIETTYRFHDPLLSLSSRFILKNPGQTSKQLKSIGNLKQSAFKIKYSVSENQDDTMALKNIFDELILSGQAKDKEIFILGRYAFDINRIKNEERVFNIDKETNKIIYTSKNVKPGSNSIAARFLTVHKAKGLEAEIIIVLNCNSGKYGFPTEMADDPVLNLLLSEADQFENAEERRLFYVAMTRAKELVYFVADSGYKSKFITELETGHVNHDIKKCPRCKTADLVKKSGVKDGKAWAFFGCINYLYGCDYRERIT